MRLIKLTQVTVTMPDDLRPEQMQSMSKDELLAKQVVGDDVDFYLNVDRINALFPNEHPKVDGGSVVALDNSHPQMPPQLMIRESIEEVLGLLSNDKKQA